MIRMWVVGGLGNQMFQYSLGRVLAIKNNTNLQLDIQSYENTIPGDTARKYELNVFRLDPDTSAIISSISLNVSKNKYIKIIIKYINTALGRFNLELVKENGHQFDPSILNTKDNNYLVGYWQSEKYFKNYSREIREGFRFKPTPSLKNKRLLEKIDSVNSVSIHIRRGDFIINPTINAFHGACDVDYYQKAIGKIKTKVKNPHFFIFSDDMKWAKKNINPGKNTRYIDHNQGDGSFEDMRLMSHCKHNIIANSSFSWWGAWLNNNKEKMVIAPKKWFENSLVNTKDIIPDTWIKI